MLNKYLSALILCITATIGVAQENKSVAKTNRELSGARTLIVFFDGLRPDYITPEYMPNLYAFKKAGAYGTRHHSVFPTVTRVNASSYSTGSYPGKNGLMGNTVYFPEVDKSKGLNTGDAATLININEVTKGKLLTARSLGQILEAAGQKMMVFSSGSSGQAYLQNHAISGGAVINTSMILPASFEKEVLKQMGPIPSKAKPNTAQHKWVTDALIKFGFASDGPLVSAIWFSDPDGAAHSDGIGSPAAMASIKAVDAEFGRIIATLKSKKLNEQFNIIISTDHGFVTHKGKQGLTEFLLKEGLKQDTASEDVVVAEGAIYVKGHNPAHIKKIVTRLQQQEWVGAIFTRGLRAGDMKGSVEGTLSFESIHWDHPERAADVLVDENWDDSKNNAGWAGAGYSKGVAGHGGMSPYEVQIPLIVSGPAFKKSYEGQLPTSNVDIAATVLHLHKLPLPEEMDGRIMAELLLNPENAAIATVQPEVIESEVSLPWGTYKLILTRSVVGKYKYVDHAKVVRVAAGTK